MVVALSLQLSKVTTRGSDQFSPREGEVGGEGRAPLLGRVLSVESDGEADEDEARDVIFFLPNGDETDAPDAMARCARRRLSDFRGMIVKGDS